MQNNLHLVPRGRKPGVYASTRLDAPELDPTVRLLHSLASILEAHQLALSTLLARDGLSRDAQEYLSARIHATAAEVRRALEHADHLEAELTARGGAA